MRYHKTEIPDTNALLRGRIQKRYSYIYLGRPLPQLASLKPDTNSLNLINSSHAAIAIYDDRYIPDRQLRARTSHHGANQKAQAMAAILVQYLIIIITPNKSMSAFERNKDKLLLTFPAK
jgi:hypothetical protein